MPYVMPTSNLFIVILFSACRFKPCLKIVLCILITRVHPCTQRCFNSVWPATCSTSFVTPSSYLSNDGFNRWQFYTGCSVCIVKSFLKTEPSWRNICARSYGTNESILKIKNMTDSILSIIWSLEKHGRYVNSMSYHLLFILLLRFQLSFIIFY